MAEQEKTETELTPELLYETQDFPVISQSYYIDWVWIKDENSPLMDRFDRGLCLPKDSWLSFTEDVNNLRLLHNISYSNLRYVTEERIGEEFFSLSFIELAGTSGVWLNFFWKNNEAMSKSVPLSEKMSTHNLEYPRHAVYFVECISAYLGYFNIQFPHIKTKLIKEVEKVGFDGFKYTINALEYSFTIPNNEDFDYQLLLNNRRGLENRLNLKPSFPFILKEDSLISQSTDNDKEQIIAYLSSNKTTWTSESTSDLRSLISSFKFLSMALK